MLLLLLNCYFKGQCVISMPANETNKFLLFTEPETSVISEDIHFSEICQIVVIFYAWYTKKMHLQLL